MTKERFASLRRHRFNAVEAELDWSSGWNEPVLERLLTRRRVNAIKRRFGLLASGDSAYFHLAPPKLRRGEVTGLPDFVGIGVQRAGTTWWFNLLTRQREIYHRPTLQIFKERQILSHLGLSELSDAQVCEAYSRWFPRRPGTITGEWTPDYFSYAWVPELLHAVAPNARLLLMLRDPVERLVSGLGLVIRLNRGAIPAAYVLEDAFQRGLYAFHLRRWLQWFPIGQMLILQYERCVIQPRSELERTLAFLGLNEHVGEVDVRERLNATPRGKVEIGPETLNRFRRLYRTDVADLAGLVPELDLGLWPSAQ